VVVVVVGGRVVVVGGRVVVVGGTVVLPPQVTPLTVNEAGAGVSFAMLGCEPDQLPWMPTELTTPPVPTLPFHDKLVAVRFWPEAVKLAFQPPECVCPLGYANVSVHDVHGSPVLVIRGVTWNCPTFVPVLQALMMSHRTLHDTAAKAGSVGSTATPPTATAPTAIMAIFRLEKRLKLSLMPCLLHVCGYTREKLWRGGRWQLDGAKTRRGKPERQGEVKT
jgi:hypothetical protein